MHMDNQAPWVSPVTVAAYARDRRNVSNKSDYKISKEGHPVPRTRPTPTGAGGSGANGSGSYSKTKQQKKKQQQQAMPGSPGGGGGSSSRNNSTNNGGAVEYSGKKIKIVGISAKSKNKKRKFKIDKKIFYSNPIKIITEVKPDILFEVIGLPDGISKRVVELALKNKIHVITPNKSLFSTHRTPLSRFP